MLNLHSTSRENKTLEKTINSQVTPSEGSVHTILIITEVKKKGKVREVKR